MDAIRFRCEQQVSLVPDVDHVLMWDGDGYAALYPGGGHTEVSMGKTDFLGGLVDAGGGVIGSIPIIGPLLESLGGLTGISDLLGLLKTVPVGTLNKADQKKLKGALKHLEVAQIQAAAVMATRGEVKK